MPARLTKLLASITWLVAAGFLATSNAVDHPTLRVLAAAVVGLPGAAAFAEACVELATGSTRETRARVKRALQAALVKISRDNIYQADVTLVSFHVWVVPMWYRRFVPYAIRRRTKSDDRKLPLWLRPHLQRLAMYRFQHHEPSGVAFRKGVGVVGRCIDQNARNHVMVVRLDNAQTKAALATDDAWHAAPVAVTQNLSRKAAQALASSYSQVAAIVIRETSGEAIGCVTLDLPAGSKIHFKSRPSDALLVRLRSTAEQVETHLTRRRT